MSGKSRRILWISSHQKSWADLQHLLGKDFQNSYEVDQIRVLSQVVESRAISRYDLIILESDRKGNVVESARKLCGRATNIPLIVLVSQKNKDAGEILASGVQFVLPRDGLQVDLLNQAILAAINRKKAELELRRRDQVLSAVNFAAGVFLTRDSWEESMPEVLETLGKAADSGCVSLFRRYRNSESTAAFESVAQWLRDGIQPSKDGSITWGDDCIQALSKGQMVFRNSEGWAFDESGGWEAVFVPVFCDKDWWGVISLYQNEVPRQRSHIEVDALKTAAGIIGATISRQVDQEKLTYLATHDHLTSLPNRMLFEDRFQQAVARAVRSRDRIALVSIDLDKFKSVNDSYGHPVGDIVLIEVGKRLTTTLRGSDTCARIGGDEFVVIAENLRGKVDALRVMQKLTASLVEPIIVEDFKIQVSASMGAALYPDSGTDLEMVMKAADKALYAVKERQIKFTVYKDEQYSWLKE